MKNKVAIYRAPGFWEFERTPEEIKIERFTIPKNWIEYIDRQGIIHFSTIAESKLEMYPEIFDYAIDQYTFFKSLTKCKQHIRDDIKQRREHLKSILDLTMAQSFKKEPVRSIEPETEILSWDIETEVEF